MIYFIRHAESHYNLVEQHIKERIGPDYFDTEEYLTQKWSTKYLDVEITPEGEAHAAVASKEVADIDFDLILVSPLRRALHTCSIFFNNHKSKAPIIVEPAFREIMQSSNDMGTAIQESILHYKDYDFSRIVDKQAWYIHTLSQEADKTAILSALDGLTGVQRSQKCTQEMLKIMQENWNERRKHPEQQEQLKRRIMPDSQKQRQILKELSSKYPKIAVVAHSECIKHYAGYKIKNCQVFPYAASSL